METEKLSRLAIRVICENKRRNVNKNTKNPMLNETMQMLRDFYRPYNQELAALLNDDSFLWLDWLTD